MASGRTTKPLGADGTCQIFLTDGETRCSARAQAGFPPLCPEHRKQYATHTRDYKQLSQEAGQYAERAGQSSIQLNTHLDELIANEQQRIDALYNEIKARRTHHGRYFGQGTPLRMCSLWVDNPKPL